MTRAILGIIGGSGIYDLPGLKDVRDEAIESPWGEPSAPPAGLRCSVLPDGGGPLVAWGGPWAHDVRWWDARRRRALWQVVVGGRPDGIGPESGGAGPDGIGVACLVVLERGHTAVEALYD